VVYDKTRNHIEISATATEAIAAALRTRKTSRRRPCQSLRQT
jgi:post-segregation antitoxin (ccd killing protein)